jgi:D-tagatose-1,6-bisphosphate aldolase subunit GatZ/KbaZ
MVSANPLKAIAKQGCVAVTGANPFVLKACMKYAKKQDEYFICEATVNQVNQFGGYTGMRPLDYARLIQDMAREINFPFEKIMLSGDHLGPFTWQHLDRETAMANSRELVRQYVAAGFRKIHLDTSMPLADDDRATFGNEIIAGRAAELAAVSEQAYAAAGNDTFWSYRPAYVIGSEVPVPGGTEDEEAVFVTRPADLAATIDSFQRAFLAAGLPQVNEDIVAVVAQIGIEFSDETVHEYNHDAVSELAAELKKYPSIRFESHSSDYQTGNCLRLMVQDGVGILKVGPETTFKLREGLFALAGIEKELADLYQLDVSNFIAVLEQAMLTTTPNYWQKYYHGSPQQQAFKRKYSYSDRSRYYLAQPAVSAAMQKLIRNLSAIAMPLTVISQYLPEQYDKIRNRQLECDPVSILEDKIQSVIHRYHTAMREASLRRDVEL